MLVYFILFYFISFYFILSYFILFHFTVDTRARPVHGTCMSNVRPVHGPCTARAHPLHTQCMPIYAMGNRVKKNIECIFCWPNQMRVNMPSSIHSVGKNSPSWRGLRILRLPSHFYQSEGRAHWALKHMCVTLPLKYVLSEPKGSPQQVGSLLPARMQPTKASLILHFIH